MKSLGQRLVHGLNRTMPVSRVVRIVVLIGKITKILRPILNLSRGDYVVECHFFGDKLHFTVAISILKVEHVPCYVTIVSSLEFEVICLLDKYQKLVSIFHLKGRVS